MHKCFYLICPTDCLEYAINNTFKYQNYFYASLGNSFNHDSKTIESIITILKKYNIEEICFVLSMDNKMVLDALGNKEFSNIGTLHNFYNEITIQKERSKISFQRNYNRRFAVLSFYLNKKIKELELQITNVLNRPIKIGGKIYSKDENTFTNIYSDLLCIEKYNLN
jgi:hypothetical protein